MMKLVRARERDGWGLTPLNWPLVTMLMNSTSHHGVLCARGSYIVAVRMAYGKRVPQEPSRIRARTELSPSLRASSSKAHCELIKWLTRFDCRAQCS